MSYQGKFTVAADVLDVLQRSRIEGLNLYLPDLYHDRPLYNRVMKVIAGAGGTWNKKAQAHIFNADPKTKLGLVLETGTAVNEQQKFQAFYTPGPLASRMAVLANLNAGDTLLEPSAGNGQLLRAALAHGIAERDITAVEINPLEAGQLKDRFRNLVCGDFLACAGWVRKFDRILMNPPFSRGQDIAHIKHAFTMLADGGRLVAICGNGARQRQVLEPLCAEWHDLEPGTFKASGTGVNTALLVFERATVDEPPPRASRVSRVSRAALTDPEPALFQNELL